MGDLHDLAGRLRRAHRHQRLKQRKPISYSEVSCEVHLVRSLSDLLAAVKAKKDYIFRP